MIGHFSKRNISLEFIGGPSTYPLYRDPRKISLPIPWPCSLSTYAHQFLFRGHLFHATFKCTAYSSPAWTTGIVSSCLHSEDPDASHFTSFHLAKAWNEKDSRLPLMLYQELRHPFDCQYAQRAQPPTYKKGFIAQGRRHHNRFRPQWPSWKLDPRWRPYFFRSRSIPHMVQLGTPFSTKIIF
jgi:hypothetical protein